MQRLAGSIILLTGWKRSLLAMMAGALTVLTQAPYDFPAVAFVTFPVLTLLLDGAVATNNTSLIARLRPAFAVGWWFGFGYFLAGLWWIGGALLVEADSYAWALPFAVLGLPLSLAFFHALACTLARMFWSDGLGRVVALAFGFAIAECLRGFLLTGFPWNPLGFAAMPMPIMMQSVMVVGTTGMNALAVFVFASPVLLFAGRRSFVGPVMALLLVVAHLGFGAWWLSRPAGPPEKTISVRIVQPNIDLAEKWDDREKSFRSLLDLSASPSGEDVKRPALIIWPETSVPYILSEAPGALSAIGDMLQPGQTLLAGSVRQEGATPETALYYNSILQIDDAGEIVDAVDKVHLVPFGEYIPFKDALSRIGLRQLVAGPMNYEAGSTRHNFKPGGTEIAPFICYEIIFPELMPRRDDGAQYILNVTNDAWFGDTPGPYQHLRQAQLRAVQTGKPVLRAANTGVSAIIDPSGRILDALSLNTMGTIDAEIASIPIHNRQWGDATRNGLAIIAAFGLLAAGFRFFSRSV